MIWQSGRVTSEPTCGISPLDRAFEHGLGLFETLRTWKGTATLLERHLQRLRQSAAALGLSVEADCLPDEPAVRALVDAYLQAQGETGDVRLRITLTGGLSTSAGKNAAVWMTAGSLPPPIIPGAIVARTITVPPDDPLTQHKTLNYWRMRKAHEEAMARGEHEVLCLTPDGMVQQGTRSNLFLIESSRIVTPADSGALLPGVMRGTLLELARKLGLEAAESLVSIARLHNADEVFLTSSVRGIVPVARVFERSLALPGPVTRKLSQHLLAWLEKGGDRT